MRLLRVAATTSVLLGCLSAPVSAQVAVNPYIDADDIKASQDSIKATEQVCDAEGFKGGEALEDSRGDRRADLEDAVGGDNVIKKVLEESAGPDDMGNKASEHITTAWLIGKAGPMVASFIMLFFYFLCCWTACCKCCRCCAKERSMNFIVFIVGFVLLCGVGLGVVISGGLAVAGHGSVSDGFSNMECTTAQLLDMTLNGEDSPKFIGMMPMLETFNKLDGLLNDGSEFQQEMNTMLDGTKTMDAAVSGASGVLALLSTTLALPANANPMDSAGTDLLHKCTFCTEVAAAVAPVKETLDNGAGASLNKARTEVKDQLSGQAKTDLQGTLRNAASPIQGVKDMFVSTFGGIVGSTSLSDSVGGAPVRAGVVMLLLAALGLVACAVLAFGSFYLCQGKKLVHSEESSSKNPHGVVPARLACLTWCCGCWLVFVALLFGGILTIISVPMSGVCLIMDDINSANLQKMGPALGMNMSSSDDGQSMIFDIIDSCFAERDPLANANLLDLVKTPTGNGSRASIRQEIVEKVKDQIVQQFNESTSKMSAGGGVSLSDDAGIVALRSMLGNNDVEVMILPTAALASDSTYSPLSGASGGASNLTKFAATGSECNDRTPEGVADTTPVPGIDPFVDALTSLGTVPFGTDCAKTVTCNVGPNSNICEAGNGFMKLKQQIRGSSPIAAENAVYRCDLFEDPDDPLRFCDPKDMNPVTFQGDCMTKASGETGQWKIKEQTCSMTEFSDYVKGFDLRLKNVFKRLDVTTVEMGPKINTELQALVTKYILDEIDAVADGAGCGFMTKTYRELIDGFCYQGVWGLYQIAQSYVNCAVLMILMIVIVYILYRVAIDNYDKGKEAVKKLQNP